MWPIPSQEALLSAALEGYPRGVVVWLDKLDPGERRGHRISLLIERENMLRPSARRTGPDIYMASLAVFAWTADDMLEQLTFAMKRHATIHALDAGLVIPPNAGADILHQAVIEFAKGRKSRLGLSAGRVGGKISAERRSAAAKTAAESVRAEWRLPSEAYPTIELIEKSGVSLNTLKTYLGRRSDAQRDYLAAEKRREKREAKNEQ